MSTPGPIRILVAVALLAAAVTTAAAEFARVATNRANLRKEPRNESAVIVVLERGAEVEIVARAADWWQVRVVTTGVVGFVRPLFLVGGEAPVAPVPEVEPVAPPPPPAPSRRAAARTKKQRDYARFRIDLGGAFLPMSSSFSESRTITEFAEQGRIDTEYQTDPGPGFDGGILFRFSRHVGIGAAASLVSRSTGGSFDAELPHPLYFRQPRRAQGNLGSLSYRETAVHLDLVYTAGNGPLLLHLFAGPSFVSVKSDLLDDVEYQHSYPFDEVRVTGTSSVSTSDNPFGFNVGAAFDYQLGKTFGLGAQARYTRATARLTPVENSTVDFDAGGFQIGLGLRVSF